MGLFGSIAGGALSAAGSIIGGITASKAMNKVMDNLKEQKQANQNWYDRRYNEDATQRADAQRMLTKTEEAIKARNKAAAGSAAVMGGTEESVAATKAANAQAMADATSQIAVNAESRKDNIESQYRTTDSNLQSQINDMEIQKANAIGQAVQGVAQAGSSMMGAF